MGELCAHNQSKKMFKLTSEWSAKSIPKNTYTNTFSTDLLFSFRLFFFACILPTSQYWTLFWFFFARFILNFPFRFAAAFFGRNRHQFFYLCHRNNFFHMGLFLFLFLCFIVNSVDAHRTDNVDRRFGKRFNDWHRLYERAIIGFKTSHSQINSKADTEKGASQYDVHMSSTKYGRPNIPFCKAQAWGKYSIFTGYFCSKAHW